MKLVSLVCAALVAALGLVVGGYLLGGEFHPLQCTLLRVGCPKLLLGGYTTSEFAPMKKMWEETFAKGDEIGARMVIYHAGEKVVDLWGGYASVEKQTPFDPDTLSVIFSSGKNMEALAIAMLADRGYIEYDAKVASYWPEFGCKGKENTTVAQVMRHEAGLSLDLGFIADQQLIADPPALASAFAAAEPHFVAGSPRCYHAITRGWLVSELVRRTDPKGRSLAQFVREEIIDLIKEVNPNNELYIGDLPAESADRVAPFYQTDPISSAIKIFLPYYLSPYLSFISPPDAVIRAQVEALLTPNHPLMRLTKVIDIAMDSDPNWIHGYRNVEMSSAGTISNAQTLAYLASIMTMGGRDEKNNVTLLSPSGHANALDGRVVLADGCHFGVPFAFGNAGFADLKVMLEAEGWEGWGGFGGSVFAWNREQQLGVGYVMNGMHAGYGIPAAFCGKAAGLVSNLPKAQ